LPFFIRWGSSPAGHPSRSARPGGSLQTISIAHPTHHQQIQHVLEALGLNSTSQGIKVETLKAPGPKPSLTLQIRSPPGPDQRSITIGAVEHSIRFRRGEPGADERMMNEVFEKLNFFPVDLKLHTAFIAQVCSFSTFSLAQVVSNRLCSRR